MLMVMAPPAIVPTPGINFRSSPAIIRPPATTASAPSIEVARVVMLSRVIETVGAPLDISRPAPPPYTAGRFARRNMRTWRTASGTRSFGSFHGYRLTWEFGASRADSIATA